LDSLNNASLAEELQQLHASSVRLSERLSVYILSSKRKSSFPAVLHALGTARKLAFAGKGAGGQESIDIDDFDDIYHQMMVVEWDQGRIPEIVGGYRFYFQQYGAVQTLDMERLFNMDEFYRRKENMPAIELGRSFIIPRLQKQSDVFSALLSGLGIILNLCHEAQVFFGKITFYPGNPRNGDVLNFLQTYHGESPRQMYPRQEETLASSLDFSHLSYQAALKQVRGYMPEILRIYLRFTEPQYALVSGAAKNEEFGKGILEAAFRIIIPAIGEIWRKRFLYPFAELQGKRSAFSLDNPEQDNE